jgi:putative flippase GtrA
MTRPAPRAVARCDHVLFAGRAASGRPAVTRGSQAGPHVAGGAGARAAKSLFTFAVDLLLLTTLHGGLRWPLPVSITVAYLTAFGLSFVLNRALNFRSHGAVGPQVTVYAAVVAVNYLVWILGVGDGLAALGADYRLARIAAGACEALYMYAAMRWLVFRDVHARDRPRRRMSRPR